ncbi:MAG: contractile injection system tape measure protein, partial [Pseudomonadota bacterium]|nr:contractile injection system tape measure protein [Pseudomonadota bacterium]
MPVTHQIGDLVLDLTFRSSAGARRTVDDIQSWLEDELLPELDELLTRYSSGRETLRLGAIDLDCGTLTRNNYKQVIRKRLFDELERVIPPQLLALNPEISFTLNSGAAPEDTALHQLLGFLESGQLPWHRLQSDDELHGQLFDRIATHPQLARVLQPALRSGPALRRLVRQFSEARLNTILANLAPGLVPLAIALQDLFDLGELTRRIGRAARSAIHEAQWTGLLSMGFARENTAPDAAMLTSLLRNWLAAADTYPDAIAAALVAPVTRSGWTDASAAHRTLGEAVLRLARDTRATTTPSRIDVSGAAADSTQALRATAAEEISASAEPSREQPDVP